MIKVFVTIKRHDSTSTSECTCLHIWFPSFCFFAGFYFLPYWITITNGLNYFTKFLQIRSFKLGNPQGREKLFSGSRHQKLFNRYLHATASSIRVTFAKWAVFGIPRHLIPWACRHSYKWKYSYQIIRYNSIWLGLWPHLIKTSKLLSKEENLLLTAKCLWKAFGPLYVKFPHISQV